MSRRKSPAALDPEEVLAGRVKITAVELLDLIHRVNPTGRDVGARAEELRYGLKSRLQSLLVRRFASSVEVVPDPDREGTVSLLHRGHERDGCHAVIAALDEDARAWVQMQVDLASGPAEPPAPPPRRPSSRAAPPAPASAGEEDDPTPSASMRRAADAVGAYDYEGARHHLERALSVSGGAQEPAEAMLGLLVETLGADVEALALEASLSRAALAAPGVSGLLALAAARTGDDARALALVRGAAERQAAAVFAALAAGAVSASDAARAADHLEQARRRDPAHAALPGLATEIARVRAAERGPIEAELGALVAAGRDAEAEKMAGEVLARWPESEAARRALRAVEDRRRRVEAEQLAAEAEAALAVGDTAEAHARLARAMAAARGPERHALERRMRTIEAADRAARDAFSVERVAGLLAAANPKDGLLAYLELDDALRARVVERAGAAVVRWLDLTGRGAPQARVDAVLALARAHAQMAREEEEAALATLGPHLGLLDRVPEAKHLWRAGEAKVGERRAARATEAVEAARAALASGAAADALHHLDEATLRDGSELERIAAAALRAEAIAAVVHVERVARLGQLRAARRLFEARRIAEDLAADAHGEERSRWLAERGAIQAAIQRDFRVEVDEEPTPIDQASGLSGLISFWDAQRWLLPDGRSLVMAESHERWVLVHVYDVVRWTLRTRVVLRAPEAGGPVSVSVTGDTLWLLTLRGGLLALSTETWEVKLHRPSAEVLPAGTTAASTAFPLGEGSPAPRFLWVEPFAPGTSHAARVVDLEQVRPGREVPETSRIADLPGGREPRVTCFRDGVVVLHEDRGTAVPRGRVRVPGGTPVGAALHPDGLCLVLLARTQPAPGGEPGYAFTLMPDGGPPGPLQPIEGAAGAAPAMIARAGDAGLVVILFDNLAGGTELLALDASPGKLDPLYRVPVSRHVVLAQDAHGRKLFAVECPVGRLAAAELGRTPPELPAWSIPTSAWLDNVIDLKSCLSYKEKDRTELRELGDHLSSSARAALVRNYQRGLNPSVDYGFTLVTALEEAGPLGRQEARHLLEWIWERFPLDPEARLHHASRLAQEGRWADVERLFDASLDDAGPRAAHFHHLLAFAALRGGDPDRARALLAEARTLFAPRICNIQALEELLSPPPDPPIPPTEAPSLAQIAEDARTADRCFARGDAGGALTAMSHEQYWAYGGVQIFARMAEAHLRIAPANLRERFRKIMVLAAFLDAHRETDLDKRLEIPIPGGTWEKDRLDALAERASAWLDGLGSDDG